MQGYEGLDKNMFFTGNKIKGYNWALAKEHLKLEIRKYAFSQRNRLPGECANATSVNMFKNKLDD